MVWTDTSGGDADVKALTTQFGLLFVATGVGDQHQSDIDGDTIVYREGAGGGDIFRYDIATGTVSGVATAAGDQSDPVISENIVAYLEASTILRADHLVSGAYDVLAEAGRPALDRSEYGPEFCPRKS